MLRSIGGTLVQDGHHVTVWTEQPNYKPSDMSRQMPSSEEIDGIVIKRINRLWGARQSGLIRTLDRLLFPFRIFLKSLFHKIGGTQYDLVWTATIPPVVQGLIGRKIANLFSAKFLYHCQDVYPELGVHSGLWSQTGSLNRWLLAVEKKTRQRADLLVTLSQDMAGTIGQSLETNFQTAVLNNFQLEDFSNREEESETNQMVTQPARESSIQMIFAGNIGIFQGLEHVIEAMQLIQSDTPDLSLLFLGDGKNLENLKKMAERQSNIQFLGHRSFHEAKKIIAAADVGIVSLQGQLFRYAYPSKALTYWGLSLPALAIVDAESELSLTNQNQAAGWSVGSNDPAVIADCLRELGKLDRAELAERKKAVQFWYETNVSRTAVLKQWKVLMRKLDREANSR